jgi:uroporphyrinogen III methyltransferase/synthase
MGRLEGYDWVVFTSANGVARFWRELAAVRQTTGIPSGQRVAAIGPATAAALEERGVRPDLVPSEYVAEAVAAALLAAGPLEGRRLLLPRAAGARQVLPAELRAAGATVDDVVAYETVGDAEGIAALRALLLAGGVDMVTFTAASTVRHYVRVAGPDLGQAGVAVIGPITAQAAREVGVRVDVEAREYTEEGLLQVICDYFSEVEDSH